MTRSLTYWRTFLLPTVDAVFGPIGRLLDKRRRKKSFRRPVNCGHGRDALKYYEHGRSVVTQAELSCGYGGSGRLIYRNYSLKRDDNHEQLSEAEAERVIQSLCAELDRKNVRWQCVDVN
jgi:hypothetical protein